MDDLEFVLLGDLANTTEDTCKFTNVEQVVELSWCWEQTLSNSFPNSNSSIDKKGLHIDNVLSVSLRSEESTEYATINVSD